MNDTSGPIPDQHLTWEEIEPTCAHKHEVPPPRAGGMAPIPRCDLKPPTRWPVASRSLVRRWLVGGGDLLQFGHCSRDCPKTP